MNTSVAPGKPKARKKAPLIGLVVILVIVLLAVAIAWSGWLGYQEAPKTVEMSRTSGRLTASYAFTQAQQDHLSQYGYPEAFTILFYEEATANGGSQDMRLESWDYYSQKTGYTFINGELTSTNPLETDETFRLDPLPYTPDQFTAYMSLEDLVASAGIGSYMVVPLGEPYLDQSELYYAPALSFGIKNGQLRYVEALAVGQAE